MRPALFILTGLFAIALAGYSKTIHVPGDYPTIQKAIDASVPGDKIIVSPGTYVENVDFKGKAVTVESKDGASVTAIDGNMAGSVVTFINGEKSDSVMDGFTIENGMANKGGGICCSYSDPTITHCTIRNNLSIWSTNWDGGGGMNNHHSDPLVTYCTFHLNRSTTSGGGMYNYASGPTVLYCTFTKNAAEYMGGGIFGYDSSPDILNSLIHGNTAHRGGGIGCENYGYPVFIENIIVENSANEGGGIYCEGEMFAYISNNKITGNLAFFSSSGTAGGGICCRYSDPYIVENFISNNFVEGGEGGGICCVSYFDGIVYGNVLTGNKASNGGGIASYNTYSTLKIANNLIHGNTAMYYGGGMKFYDSSSLIINSTFFGNSAGYKGGGIWAKEESSLVVVNAIMWDDSAGYYGPEIAIGDFGYTPSSLTVSHSDVEGGQTAVYLEPGTSFIWGPGMIDLDPLFVDSATGDFHLTFPSPCKDTGDNMAVNEFEDFEGDPRIAYGTVDMGADEFYTHLYYTGNATPNGNAEVKFVGLPRTTPVGLCIGSGLLDPPLKSMWGDWYLQFPIIGPIGMPQIASNGVLIIPGTIPGSPPPPYSITMQALIGAELTNVCTIEVK